MGTIIPLLLALLATELFRHRAVPATGWPMMLAAAAVGLGLWFLAAEGAARVLAWRRDRLWLRHWEDHAAQGLILGLFAWLCYQRGWAAWAPGYTAAIAPWLLGQCILWWTLAPVLRSASTTPWTRGGLVLHHLRFDLAPVLIALPVMDLCTLIGNRTGIEAWMRSPAGLSLAMVGSSLLIAGILFLIPRLLVPLWGARPLPPGPLADALAADCLRAGIPDARLRVWGSPGGQVFNAIALGLPPGPRWVLVSADLIEALPPDQVRAVVGHELGHHQHRHLMSYVWFALLANVALGLLCQLLLGTCDATGTPLPEPFGGWAERSVGAVFQLPGADQIPADLVIGLTLVPIVLLFWRVLFGVLSRACERQADIAGSELTSPEHMAAALQAVARLSRTPETAPSWRHRPIAERVAFLAELAGSPRGVQDQHRLIRDMRLLIIASLALLVALAAGLRFNPLRASANSEHPAADITAMADADPALRAALAAADNADTRPLVDWLNHAEPADRLKLIILHLREADLSGGLDGEKKQQLPMDDRSLYRMRWRFSAFSAVPHPDAAYNLMVDNAFAYGLVAGTAQPTAHEVELARSVLPRLEAAMERDPDPAIWDTIGCVRFAGADWAGARKAFAEALRLLPAASNLTPSERQSEEQIDLRRQQAAEHNLAEHGQPPLPLPLKFVENHAP